MQLQRPELTSEPLHFSPSHVCPLSTPPHIRLTLKFARSETRVFIGRTDVEAETPICWPPDVKS